MPRFLSMLSARLTRYGYTVEAGAGSYPATLQNWLVPVAKRLNWYGYQVS